MADFTGKNVLLGVTGGIAAYKAAELARELVKKNANVKVVMTAAGQRFVTPLTFRTITRNPVATELFADPGSPYPHISLSDEADLIIVAPATANIIAKYARGVADDLLSTTLIAARGKVIMAPAMNTRMYLHAATQENMAILKGRGVVVVEPGTGELACGDEGVGRMAEPVEILEAASRELARARNLAGKKIVITAGPTREHIDPVRFISNPSTGRMGYAIAESAARRGADVVLISGPVDIPAPAGVKVTKVSSAVEMKEAVLDNMNGTDALIMAAAVADFRPAERAKEKLRKSDGIPEVDLEPTEDILGEVSGRKGGCLVVGFAAETNNVVEHARAKLDKKGMDLVVANRVDHPESGFATGTNLAAIIGPSDEEGELVMMTKPELAELLLDRLAGLLG